MSLAIQAFGIIQCCYRDITIKTYRISLCTWFTSSSLVALETEEERLLCTWQCCLQWNTGYCVCPLRLTLLSPLSALSYLKQLETKLQSNRTQMQCQFKGHTLCYSPLLVSSRPHPLLQTIVSQFKATPSATDNC